MFQQTNDFSSIFASKSLCSKSADIDFVLVFTIQNGSRTFFFMLLFAWIWDLKKHPKTYKKPCPGDPKIDLENMLFFNIDFFAFWLRFWRLLGLQLGAKLAQNASAERKVAYFWTFLSWCLYNIAPWRAPASILEAPGLDLGGLRLNFCKIFTCFWPCVPRTCRDLAQLVDRNLDARLHWTPHSQPLKVHACIPMDAAVSA